MTNPSIPSINPADALGGLSGAIKHVLAKYKQNMNDMLPARVISYSRTTNRARVQPLIAMITTGNEQLQRAQIASVPVFQIGGGGYVLSFPIVTGDLGWIKANDRDISIFLQKYQESAPNTNRTHNFADAVFFPDSMMRNVVIDGEDTNHVVLQNNSGTCRVAIWDDRVKITAPHVVIDSPLTTCTGAFEAGTRVDYDHSANFHGDIITDHDVIASTTRLHTHTHNGVTTGSGNTGEPN